MESIGQRLKSAREELGYTVEQIARETNITKSYLVALENEDFDAFPGETYLIGFLRNYAEFLSIDSGEMIALFRNMQIQEQPVPLQELLVPKKSFSKTVVIAIIIIALAGIAAGGYFYIYPNYFAGEKAAEAEQPGEAAEVKKREVSISNTYEFTDEVVEKRFRKNEAVSVKLGEEFFQLVIAEINDSVIFVYPQGELEMSGGEERLLDLDGNETPDIRMILRSFDPDTASVVLHIDRFVKASGQSGNMMTVGNPEDDSPSDGQVEIRTAGEGSVGRAGAPSREIPIEVIRSTAAPGAFTLSVEFRGYCLFRYHADGSSREERYFNRGETFRLDVDSEVRLWVSNAGSFSGRINGADIDMGEPGEVSIRDIKWIYNDETGDYELQIIPVY
jgi:cytoskeletal protein RodZ